MSIETTHAPGEPVRHRRTPATANGHEPRRRVRRASAARSRAADHSTSATTSSCATSRSTVEPGEVVVILGASGCGKSTLLRIAARPGPPDQRRASGSVATPVDGHRSALRRRVPGAPAPAVADAGRRTSRSACRAASTDGAGARTRVEELLALVGLTAFAGHRPREVSGGMAQRAALARALARDPWVLLLDEPFGALDALTRLRMQDLLLEVHAAAPTTVLLVTHDVDEALQLADRVILLGAGTGRRGRHRPPGRDRPGRPAARPRLGRARRAPRRPARRSGHRPPRPRPPH